MATHLPEPASKRMDVFFNDTLVEPDIPFRWDGNTAWFAATLTRRYTHPQSWGDATTRGTSTRIDDYTGPTVTLTVDYQDDLDGTTHTATLRFEPAGKAG